MSENEIMSLFENNASEAMHGYKLNVVKTSFDKAEALSWEELFSGFDELYAITFSSGVDFMAKVLPNFKYTEVIFGNESVIGNDISLVMSLQAAELRYLSKKKSTVKLADRIEKKTLKLFVSRDTKSHEKIYILKSDDGRFRTITGSANFSYNAFNGLQRENITYTDGEEAYNYYKDLFESYKVSCSDEISHKSLIAAIKNGPESILEHPELIPVNQTIESRKETIVIEKCEDTDDYEIIADASKISEDIKPLMPKPDKSGKTIIIPRTIMEFRRRFNDSLIVKKETRSKMPQLSLDFDNKKLYFDDKECDLIPEKEDVKSDLQYFFKYMQGFDAFSGDVEKNCRNYFMFAVWYLASPFMAVLRNVAVKNGHDIKQFPVFAILYGESNGGKTEFANMLTKLMCGKKIPVNGSEDFTRTTIDVLKQSCRGVPIVIDDLDKTHYNSHSSNIIKYDNWGIKENLINYPCVAITTNELPSVKADISKRAYVCHIDACIDKSRSRENYRKIHECTDKIGTSFYHEYVRMMFDSVEEICEKMKSDDKEYLPDIFETSSEIILKIARENFGDKLPDYLKLCTFEDYFGNKAVGKNAIQKIRIAWELEPEAFTIQKKRNKIEYRIPENGDVYQLRYIKQELPPILNAEIVQRTLSMDLDEARKFFEIDFRKTFFGRK